jgi:hypothetical protein
MTPQTINKEIHLNIFLVSRTSGRSMGTFKYGSVLWNIGEHWTEQGKTTLRQLNKGYCGFVKKE